MKKIEFSSFLQGLAFADGATELHRVKFDDGKPAGGEDRRRPLASFLASLWIGRLNDDKTYGVIPYGSQTHWVLYYTIGFFFLLLELESITLLFVRIKSQRSRFEIRFLADPWIIFYGFQMLVEIVQK